MNTYKIYFIYLRRIKMKINKIMILTIVLLAILSFGAVSAQDNLIDDVAGTDSDDAISVSPETTQLDSDSNDIASDNDQSLYVDNAGSDSAAGNQNSPYATINKAISEVNASQKATIYLGEGTFTGENNTDLSIALAHQTNGGSLTIIGKGNGKTIIDADYEAPIFKSISKDSIVTLINITFTHGKTSDDGAAICNSGFLTVDSCEFISNEAIPYGYGIIYQKDANNLTILNSKFANNKAYKGADVYFNHENYLLTLIGNEFENSTSTASPSWDVGSSVVMGNGLSVIRKNTFKNMPVSNAPVLIVYYNNGANIGNITDNTFDNCTHTGNYGILFVQNSFLKNNKFTGCTAENGLIYINTDFNAFVKFNDVDVNGTSFKLTAIVSDDSGNPVRNAKVQFYIDGKRYGEASATNGVASLTVSGVFGNGKYNIGGFSASNSATPNPFGSTVENGTLTVDFDHSPIDLWVSPNGNDTDGNGSTDKPFKTIKHALDYGLENHIIVNVHLLNGLYNETGDYALSYSNVAKINLIGESKEGVVISGNNNDVAFLTSGQYTNVLLKNLTIKDFAAATSFDLRYATFEDCIVDNVKRLDAQSSPSQIIFRNVRWTNTTNLKIYNCEIYNSYFENIKSTGTGNFWLATVDKDDEIIVMNSKFINCYCTGSSGAGVFYVLGNFRSINNTFDNNKATRSGGAVYVSGNQIISINDTFTNNHADRDYGAALFYPNGDNPTVIIENAKFINNTANGNGGALGLYGAKLINCLFENNTANGNGGAICTPTHSNSIKLSELILTDVTFKDNNAVNGKDIFITPSTSASPFITELSGITVTFNDLSTKTLQDTVSADVAHESGAIVGGGAITFYLDGSKMGVADVVNGKATLDYLGFTQDGSFVLSGEYNDACDDTKYVNSTVTVTLNPLKDNVTLYVSEKGNDSSADGSLEKPFKTINAALNSGYKQSKVITVRVLEGTHYGEGNVNLTIFGSLDISIIGDGINKTIITGNATKLTWFIKLLSGGNGVLRLANMTVSKINYNYKAQNTQTSAIVTEKGTVLKIDSVEFIKNAGNNGGVINNAGELEIINSRFFNNGDSNYGASVYNTGKATIDNSQFIANHAKYYGDFYNNNGELFIYNSLIQDSMRVNGWSGNAFAIGGSGNMTIVNSTISRSGKTVFELIENGDTYTDYRGMGPAIIISIASSGNLLLDNVTIDGNDNSYSGPSVAASASIGVTSTASGANYAPASLVVINSKFLNLYTAIANQKNASVTGSYFENLVNLLTGTNFAGNVTISDSYFADEEVTLTKHADSLINLNDNWWGSNAQPTFKASNVDTHPETWLILTLNTTEDGNAILAFKSFDGENITDYDGEVYAREFAIDAVNATVDVKNGIIKNNVVIPLTAAADSLYINATVDGQQVNITRIVPDISASATPVYVGKDVVVEIISPDDLKDNITVVIDGKEYSSKVTGEKTTIVIPDLAVGNYTATVVYKGDDTYMAKSIPIDVKVIDIIIKVEDVEKFFKGSQKLNITVVDSDGKILSNEKLSVKIVGEPIEVFTDANGKASVDLNMDAGNYVAEIVLNKTKVTANVVIKSTAPASENGSAVVGDEGVETQFVDSDGKPLANTNVTFIVDGKEINKTTDENGVAKLTKEEIGAEDVEHNITVTNPVTNETVVNKIKMLTISIKAGDVEKYYRGSEKLNVTVADSEGNVLANKNVTVVIAGESLKATTDANGIALFDLNMAAGKYVAQISVDKYTATANVVIKSTVPASSNDTVINADNGFETKMMDSEGKPLANTTVTVDIDGKKINKRTDENGVLKVSKDEIGQAGTTHTISIVNPVTNETASFKVSLSKPAPTPVTPVTKIVLKAAKKTIKIKKSAKKLVVKATLKINGKKVKGKVIKFKFKGKTYKAKTNKNGVAKVTIKKKVIKKLKKGKKYTVKITYGKKSAKTIVKVRK